MSNKINVTVWNEGRHEKTNETVKSIYPNGIHTTIAENLRKDPMINARTATLDEPFHGLTDEVLNSTDVLIWWGHMAHHEVSDEIVDKVYARVQKGMGLIVLHSGHASKIFRKVCGTNSDQLKWREIGERERIWVIEPSHPIARGLEECIVIEHEEMYGERFEIPTPDELIFISWFEGGEVFRSGVTYKRGYGKVFYFRPGHESFPIYHNEDVMKVITNAVHWAYVPADSIVKMTYDNVPPREDIIKAE